MSMPKIRYLALAALLLVAGAGLYRWTDDEGRVHYSDVPPKAGAKAAIQSGQPAAKESASQGRSAPSPAAAPAALTILDANVMHDVKSPTTAIFRLAITVSAPDLESGDRLAVSFEDPDDPTQVLAGSRPAWDNGAADRMVFVSPPLSAIQCRDYSVSVKRSAEGSEEPVAAQSMTFSSRMDSASVLAGGPSAAKRVLRGERVCP